MLPKSWMICISLHQTGWKSWLENVRVNTASESTINGVSASHGKMGMPSMLKSWTIIRCNMTNRKLAPIHPGEILLEEFLDPMGISQYRLAKSISVPPRRINEIVHGQRAISADTALRLSRFFGTTDRFWLNLQSRYDLEIEKDRLGKRLQKEVEIYRKGNTAAAH